MYKKLNYIIFSIIFVCSCVYIYGLMNSTSNLAYILHIKPNFKKMRDPKPLFDDFNTYQSPDQVEIDLNADKYSAATSNKELSDGSSSPPYMLTTVSVPNYRHLNNAGVLVLSFFNNRLFMAEFFPNDFESYKSALIIHYHDDIVLIKKKKLTGGIIMSYLKDPKTRRDYFSWMDRQISDELNAWIARYS